MQEETLWSAGVGRGSATGGLVVQRKQGLDRSPTGYRQALWGTAEGVRMPVWTEGFRSPGFHVEKVAGRLSPKFFSVCLK